MMKKIVYVLLCLMFVLLLFGCTGTDADTTVSSIVTTVPTTVLIPMQAEKMVLIHDGRTIETAGTPEVDYITFYIALLDSYEQYSFAEDLKVDITLVNDNGETVYSGHMDIPASSFFEANVKGWNIPLKLKRVDIPTKDITVGKISSGKIIVNAQSASGRSFGDVTMNTSFLPANRDDRVYIQDIQVEVLEAPSIGVKCYVTFYYPGPEEIDTFSYYYNQYDKEGNIVLQDNWAFEFHIKPGSTFTALIRLDPRWNPDYIEFTKYTFSQADPEEPNNANVYWEDKFDDPHRTYLYR